MKEHLAIGSELWINTRVHEHLAPVAVHWSRALSTRALERVTLVHEDEF